MSARHLPEFIEANESAIKAFDEFYKTGNISTLDEMLKSLLQGKTPEESSDAIYIQVSELIFRFYTEACQKKATRKIIKIDYSRVHEKTVTEEKKAKKREKITNLSEHKKEKRLGHRVAELNSSFSLGLTKEDLMQMALSMKTSSKRESVENPESEKK